MNAHRDTVSHTALIVSGVLGPLRMAVLAAACLALSPSWPTDLPGPDGQVSAQEDFGDDDDDDDDDDSDDDFDGDDDFDDDDFGDDDFEDDDFGDDDAGDDDFGDDDVGDDDLDDDAGDDDDSGSAGDDDDRDDNDRFDDDIDEDDFDEDEIQFEGASGIDPDDFDFDERGFPARSNEILAFDLGADDLAIARDLGFELIERRQLTALGGSIDRLRVPSEFSLPRAVDALEGALPAAPFDYNHIYLLPEGNAATDPGQTTPIGEPRSGSGIRLGVIDTLVDTRHPSLRGQSVTVRDFAGTGGRDREHGTAVVSILVGSDPVSDYSGLIPGAEIFAANVFALGDGGIPATDTLAMVEALDWLSGQNVGVISISIAGPDSAVFAEAIDRVQSRGQVVVAAVGNDGPAAPPLFPASNDGVVGVTAIDLDRRVYRRAGRGDHVDFSAPGVRVRAAAARDGYASMSGTSFATPVVAALVALQIAARDPDAGSKLSRIARSVLDLGDPGKDEIYGHGLLVIEQER